MTEFPTDGWPYHVWHRLVRRALPVAAEVVASRPHRRAWVFVRPTGDDRYEVTYFEVDTAQYELVLNTWDYDLPGLLLERQRQVVSEAELRQVIARWLSDLTTLSDPSTTSYPL